ncbi:MAG TPA: DMT family transporter [Gaiellaceae bacterium]
MKRRLVETPVLAALVGAFCIAFSGILFRVAHVSPSTGAFFRCLWALPPLWWLARREDRRYGPRSRRARLFAAAAGTFFAVDLVAWHHAVEEVGAGLATVLGNLQVVLVGPIAWLLLSERLRARTLLAIPISLGGVVLISGAVGSGAYGRNPGLGVFYGIVTALAYTGFLLTLRRGSADLRRVAGPLCDATIVAAIGSALLGVAFRDLDLTPSLRAQGWLVLLALSSQALGWLVIAVSLPRLPAALTSVLLTLQPVLSVLFAAAILGEAPSALQLLGVAGVLAALLVASAGRRGAAPARGRIGAESAQSAS